jgi:hypothetical protein
MTAILFLFSGKTLFFTATLYPRVQMPLHSDNLQSRVNPCLHMPALQVAQPSLNPIIGSFNNDILQNPMVPGGMNPFSHNKKSDKSAHLSASAGY